MATARERLLQALIFAVGQPYSEAGSSSLKRLLNSYRVQVKKGEAIHKIETARGTLAESIINKWRNGENLGRKEISKLISPFRLQLKAGLSQGRASISATSGTSADAELTNSAGLTRSQIKENILHHENAYFRKDDEAKKTDLDSIPVAGGHRPKVGARGLCPKCRSLGVVLAKEYGGEEYLSCIYCGYHGYKNDLDSKLDLPLAAGFLGDAFEEPDLDEE